MKSRLELRTKQQQRLTTGVHNLIQLLTLSNIELSDRVHEMLDENPLLELSEDAEHIETVPLEDEPDIVYDVDIDSENAPDELLEAIDDQPLDPFSDLDAAIDWTELPPSVEGSQAKLENQLTVEDNASKESLLDHLEYQLKGTLWSEQEKQIARVIFFALNESGFLETDLRRLADENADVTEPDVLLYEEVLKRVQNFTPSGIAARDLRESLLIQTRDLPESVDMREHALDLLENQFELLANQRMTQLSVEMNLSLEEVRETIALIRTLNPRPAQPFNDTVAEYIEPDVIVFRQAGQWVVEMIGSNLPSIRISPNRQRYLASSMNKSDRKFVKQKELEAKMLIDGLAYRTRTILHTAQAIVAEQQAFLEQGEEAMRPLIRADIAQAVGVHESTISRVTTNKYIATPRGTFELSFFFSSKVHTKSGGEVSAVAIRAMLREFIEGEDRKKPLSDQKLMDMLHGRNIRVARRTVAKYRESMDIPSSTIRTRKASEVL